MKFSRKTIIFLSVTLCNLLIFSIVTAVLFSDATKPADADGSSNEPPVEAVVPNIPHSIPRAARMPSPNLDWEINIGGSKDDCLQQVFDLNKLYLLGTTQSNDFDFERENQNTSPFLAIMDKSGELLFAKTFGDDTYDTHFVKACLSYNYIATVSNSTQNNGDYLITLLDYEANVIASKNIGTTKVESAQDILFYNGFIIVIAQSYDARIGKTDLQFLFLDEELNIIADRRPITEATSLFYVGYQPYDANTIAVAVNAKVGMSTYSAIYKVRNDVAPIGYEQMTTVPYEAFDIIPYKNAYLMLYRTLSDGSAFLMQIERDLSTIRHFSLNTKDTTYGTIFPAYDGSYFVHLTKQSSATLLNIDSSIINVSDPIAPQSAMSFFGGFYNSPVSTIIIQSDYGVVRLNAIQQNTSIFEGVYGGTNEETAVDLVSSGSSIIMLCNSKSKDGDVGENFGNQDIWIARI